MTGRARALVALGVTVLATPPARAQAAFSKAGSLVTLVPGINAEASDRWVGSAAMIAPTRERWVIQEEGTAPEDLRSVPPDHIIRLRTNETPERVRSAVRRITENRDVTVIVDMNIGLRITESSWAPHTGWAATVARALAESHAERYPDARNLYIGHSAGTEPGALMPETRANSPHRLYDDIMLLSPRRGPNDASYPKHAVLSFSDGDLYSNIGHVGIDPVLKAYGEPEAIAFAKKGYSVVRSAVSGDGGWADAMLTASRSRTGTAAGLALGLIVPIASSRLEEHTRITTVSATDRKSIYYTPVTATAIEMPPTSTANALKLAVDVQGGRTYRIPEAVKAIQMREPTPGIGGISLNGTAYMPIDPADVDYAGYGPSTSGESALFLRLRNGETVRLPAMDAEVVRQSYDVTYVAGQKAELSIGSNRATGPDGREVLNLQAPGKFSVHYFGNTQETLLGLVMYQADDMLGQLAYTTSDAVRDVAKRIPNFRSLVELFPEKYARHPAQGDFIGVGERVFLSPSMVELVRARTGRDLEFGEIAFSVRFGNTGPAEAAYAAMFEANFPEILKTESGAAFAQLIPYARATAVFRWMRDNNIRFVPGTLDRVGTRQVFTPAATAIDRSPKLEDVAPRRPTVFFGLDGPTRVVRADGSESTIAYRDGKVSEVRRYDGQVLRVHRDGLGAPLAIQWRGRYAAAFMENPNGGLVLATNVDLRVDTNGVGVTLGRDSMLYPIVNPESVVRSYTIRFATGELHP